MNRGFTLVEMLAVMVIMALLLIFAVPAYTAIYTSIRRDNLGGKITEIEAAALEYGEKIKDDIKNANNQCIDITVSDLIEDGYITSEDDVDAVIYDPTDNSPLDGEIRICYCNSDYDIDAHYYEEFVRSKVYHEGDVVEYNGSLYQCVIDYSDGSGINGTTGGKRYFELITC